MPNKISNNQFELIFDETKKSNKSGQISDEIIMEMGEIEEDNEIYDEPIEKTIKTEGDHDYWTNACVWVFLNILIQFFYN